ncbi:MAG: carboxypeptidase regulatory-like domain-containing protein [Acidobacteria bacterium]|nr:carboxypeptidase regulatory-like domain-containing protein [Acidobacteriota bacterium]
MNIHHVADIHFPLRICVFSIAIGFAVVGAWGMSVYGQASTGKRSGTIAGRVVTDDGQPVEGATVYCATGENIGAARMTITDSEGNFLFTGLGPSAYRLSAYTPGFVSSAQSGEERVARLGDTAVLTLVRGGVVTGRVTTGAGEPVVAVGVAAIQTRDSQGNPAPGFRSMRSRPTDDRGIYRLYGLPSGTYLIVANPSTGLSFQPGAYDQHIPTYFPSSNRDGASEISVQAGGEVTGIDINYRDVRGHSISVAVVGPNSSKEMELSAMVELLSGGGIISSSRPNAREPGGAWRFTINGVADGEYELVARGNIGLEESMVSAPRRITVRGADISGVQLSLLPLASIAGRVMLESGALPADCAKGRESAFNEILIRAHNVGKSADAVMDSMPGVFRITDTVRPNGEFNVRNLRAGPHFLTLDLPGDGWYVKSVAMPGAARRNIDLGRTALTLKAGEKSADVTVTLAEGAAMFEGKMTGERFRRGRWRAHLVPVEAAEADNTLRYYETDVGADSGFTLAHIAPGKYWVVIRALQEPQSWDAPVKRAAWDVQERTQLRREAEAAKIELDLGACARIRREMTEQTK